MSDNHLIHESSPYLLQHAHNPVDWYPWGEEALSKAKAEDKPILVSIGYSACHWCHVMERECFEKEDLAAIMNDHFINIKIDREERPDIDQIYMDAVQAMGIHGGWPLNVFLTPEAKPFYGGTYFPPMKWKDILSQLSKAFKEHREEIEKSAEGFKASINKSEILKYNLVEMPKEFTLEELDQMFAKLKPTFDLKMGGTERAPKFPMPSIYSFLLRYYGLSKNEEALQHVKRTLDRMAFGGLYDQVGGGFSRYSTDMDWFVPHFEKMLYDNGQLVSLYVEAFQLTKDNSYKEVIYETISWVKREMTNSEGGFYSAQDADSEGVEGKFYIWTEEELQSIIGSDYELFKDYYQITTEGNWEDEQNILIKGLSDEAFANKHSIGVEELKLKVNQWKELLIAVRNKRIFPGLDDKVLASWNGLMLKGIVDAYRVFDAPEFLDLALSNARFIKSKMWNGKQLFHNYKNGKATIDGYLEDYTFVIDAYISLYEATFQEEWLDEAILLTNTVLTNFYDKKEGMFYFTSETSEKLIARKKEIFDNVIPASNSSMAKNLYKLGTLLYHEEWKELSLSMLSKMKRVLLVEPSYLANWGNLFADCIHPTAELSLLGKDYLEVRKQLDLDYIPNKVLAGAEVKSDIPMLKGKETTTGKTVVYLCQDKVCQKPVEQVAELLSDLKK